MIYIPHPNFNFYRCGGGGIVGYVNEPDFAKIGVTLDWLRQYKINVDQMFSKFEKARSSAWEGRHAPPPDPTFCFVREDGEQLAIRFIRNEHKDIVAYWKLNQEPRCLLPPPQYIEFLSWLEQVCPL